MIHFIRYTNKKTVFPYFIFYAQDPCDKNANLFDKIFRRAPSEMGGRSV